MFPNELLFDNDHFYGVTLHMWSKIYFNLEEKHKNQSVLIKIYLAAILHVNNTIQGCTRDTVVVVVVMVVAVSYLKATQLNTTYNKYKSWHC